MTQDYRHDPALCSAPDCGLCNAFNVGYSAGKAKAQFELRALDHYPAAGCGCEPCKTARPGDTTGLAGCYMFPQGKAPGPGSVESELGGDRAETSPRVPVPIFADSLAQRP